MVLEARVAKRHSSYQSPPPLPTMGEVLQASALLQYGNMAIWKGWRSLLEKCLNRKKENSTYNIVAAASVDETLATFGADLPEMFQL